MVAQNDPDAEWAPSLFSRFDFVWGDDGAWFYCQGTYDAESAEMAETAEAPDPTDVESGCSGFSWTGMSSVY